MDWSRIILEEAYLLPSSCLQFLRNVEPYPLVLGMNEGKYEGVLCLQECPSGVTQVYQ